MKRIIVMATVVVAALGLTGAGAHPTVVQVGEGDNTVGYVFAQHGFTGLFQETNDIHDGGAINYASAEPVVTGLQVHDACIGIPDVDDEAWQVGHHDPFYSYLPWQITDAGYDDNPAAWIDWIDANLGFLLTEVEDVAQACADLGGTFAVADTEIAKV